MGGERVWNLMNREDYINGVGGVRGKEGMEEVKGGVKGI